MESSHKTRLKKLRRLNTWKVNHDEVKIFNDERMFIYGNYDEESCCIEFPDK